MLVLIFCIPIVPLLGKKRFVEKLALKLPSASLGDGNIWIHALSVGEVIAAVPLVKILSMRYAGMGIVFTVTTSKGMAVARNELEGKVKILLTMPIDFLWCIRRIVNYVRPSIFILVETDIWPALIGHLRKRGIRSILVNGRFSPRTLRRYRKVPFFVRQMFESLELCLVQSDLDRERLLRAGTYPPVKVRTVGNIKFDRDWIPMSEEERLNWLSLLGLESENLIWVAGSTHAGEEETLLEVFKRLRTSFAVLRLIIAPRIIEQSDGILRRAQSMGLKTTLKTELPKNRRPYDVLVLNSLGELGRIYGLSKVSFVGGSLVPIGGHNLLEPASFGCPVLFGNHTHNFDRMSESLVEAGGGWRVHDGKELYEAMKMLLGDAGMCVRMGRLAREFVEKNRGALDRVVTHIGMYMGETGGLH
jgi:3-deoxy-D-manno-octulosonic-acid transferase